MERIPVVAMLATSLLIGSSCLAEPAEPTTASSTTGDPSSEGPTTGPTQEGSAGSTSTSPSPAPGSSSTPDEALARPASLGADDLRQWLGADRLVVRLDGRVVAVSDLGRLAVTEEFPGVFADHLVVDGTVLDYAGRPVCPGFELLGDSQIIDDAELVDGAAVIVIEDRRAYTFQDAVGSVDLPRRRHDCATAQTIELAPTTTVEYGPERLVATATTDTGLVLLAEWGLGDTPLQLSNGQGTVLVDRSERAYDYRLSADEATIFATTYAGTGAAEPPDGVVAVDAATGLERWRHPVGGFVWTIDDRVIVEEVAPRMTDLGTFAGREVVVLDAATGAELDRVDFVGRIVGLF